MTEMSVNFDPSVKSSQGLTITIFLLMERDHWGGGGKCPTLHCDRELNVYSMLVETNKNRILAPLLALDQMSETH